MYRGVAAGFAILMALLSTRLASADDQTDTRTFALHYLRAQDAATIVRTITGIRKLAAPDAHSIEATGTRVALQLTAELLSALDAPEVEPSQTFTTGDETAVAVIPLRDISPSAAMAALRKLQIQRVAASVEPAVVVVRDTPEQVASAIAALDETSSEQRQ
jgi:hypothetical protein